MHIAEVNENSTRYLDIIFKDENDVLAAPNSVVYRIDCVTTGTSVKSDTTVNTPGDTMRINLNKTETAIVADTNKQELKRVSIIAIYGANDEENDEFDFYVKNLAYIS
ncbi:MAG: hypothetical protein GXP08_11880 [Gammaproteobacteria bacterium]|nr:hypothetical protein [Gammaproteobacteria bacterium]